jgi:hypothetical protein
LSYPGRRYIDAEFMISLYIMSDQKQNFLRLYPINLDGVGVCKPVRLELRVYVVVMKLR